MKKIVILFAATAILFGLISCNKVEKDMFSCYSSVTFKTQEDGTLFLEVDDTTAVIPVNYTTYPFKGYPEKRGVATYLTDFSTTKSLPGYKRTFDVTLTQMDTVYTKNPVASTGSAEGDDTLYGKDKLGIYFSGFPYTTVEDGYLFLSFSLMAGGSIPHDINLVTGLNPDDPYEIELRHNAHSDAPLYQFDGTVNFSLKDLPDTNGETVDLTLKWTSLVSGEKESFKFKYCSRTDWPVPNM